ncbi:MAG: DUF5320 domain-containing protein [Anaerolineae bacterium]|nr:DUF5320 domain-containing protein [Anaerolineae bacterium]
MPRGDRTGPAGMGPMTGRGAGYCAGYSTPGYANPVGGRGFGMGFGGRGGGGWGRRNWYYATGVPGWARFGSQPAWGAVPPVAPSREQEVQALRSQQETLGSMLEDIQARLRELEDQG